jgi:hypothetical protein
MLRAENEGPGTFTAPANAPKIAAQAFVEPQRENCNMMIQRLAAFAAIIVAALLPDAHAGEVYTNIGFPGLMLGYAEPLNANFTLRGDLATLGSRSREYTEEGINYNGKLKATRGALFGDWYPFSGTFRFTAGVTSNNYQLDLVATGAGGTLTIGNTTYTTTPDDRFEAKIKFPKATPYLGLGWGHQVGSGFRFSADIGAMLGKAKLTTALSGPNANQVSQADIDAETAELRDGVAKVRWLPQITIGFGYSF